MRKLGFVALILSAAPFACKSEPPPTPPPPPVTAPPTTQPAPVSVGGVALGKAVGEDKKVTTPGDSFGVKDTIYASVDTQGVGKAKIRALWSYVKGEKTAKVDETTIDLTATGPTVNEFHISKPSGWPKGDYKIEIFLNDETTAAQTKTFKVG
jgi:hypothetical protein